MKAILENIVLITQSLFYLTGIGVMVLLAVLFWQSMQAQNAYHQREDARLQQSLRHDNWLLEDHRQFLADHQRTMERLAR